MKISFKAARVNANLTQKELAKLMNKSEATIKNWENGKTIMSILDFKLFCNIVKINENNIFLPSNQVKVD